MSANEILFISLSNIGDTILTTPVLESLHTLYPDSIIDIVSDNRSKIIYKHCPYRGEIIIKNKQGLFRGGFSLVNKLRQKRYEVIVDLRTDGLTVLLNGKLKLTKRSAVPYGKHAVEEHMGVIRKLSKDNEIPATRTWLMQEHEEFARSILGELVNQRILAIAPGCHVPIKVWDPVNYKDLCNNLATRFDAVVLLGAEADKEYTQKIVSGLTLPYKDLAGQTDVLQAAAILKYASLFIGNDSGLGHLASTADIPTLTLFGIGNPDRYRPWGRQARWLRGKNNLVNNIKVDDVVSFVKKEVGE